MPPSVDQELIQLLGQKISLLKSNLNGSEATETAYLLAQAGVPEFVWQNLVLSCTAASTASPPLITNKPRSITIIGGRGKMGRFFTQQLVAVGHEVRTMGRNDWSQADRLLGEAELVIICVSIEQTLTVIEQAVQYLNPSTVLADLTSIKTPIVEAMLKRHPGPVLGLHPMFGPGVHSFLSQNVVVCPGRKQQAVQWFLDLIENQGGKLIYCTPQEHDRMMIIVQSIRHFFTLSFGVFLAEAEVNLSQSLDFSSPLYRLQLNIVSRLFTQDASLSVEMMLAEEERRQTIAQLASICSRLAQMVVEEDETALQQKFEATGSFFESQSDRALAESEHLINSLSLLLAANEVQAIRQTKSAEPLMPISAP